jgi:hypothetical protein
MIGPSIPAGPIAVYGLGLYKRTKCGHTLCEHSGGLHGVSTKGGLLLGENYGFAVLCNQGDEDMDDIMWTLYNAVMGLPLETSHRWFIAADHAFSNPEMLAGRYVCHEGVPAITTVNADSTAIHGGNEVNLIYCGGGRFLAMDAKEPNRLRSRMEFFIRNGQAWGVRCGSRIYSREDV